MGALRQISLQGALIWTKLPQIITCGHWAGGAHPIQHHSPPAHSRKDNFPIWKVFGIAEPIAARAAKSLRRSFERASSRAMQSCAFTTRAPRAVPGRTRGSTVRAYASTVAAPSRSTAATGRVRGDYAGTSSHHVSCVFVKRRAPFFFLEAGALSDNLMMSI